MGIKLVWMVLWVWVVLCSNPATGQPDPFAGIPEDQVRMLLDLMREAGEAELEQRWCEAAAIYGRMWELLSVEEYRFGQAHCLEQCGEYREALALFEELARSSRPEVVRSASGRAHTLLLLVNSVPARLHVECEMAGAVVEVDGQVVGVTSDQALEFSLPSGSHHLVVYHDGLPLHDVTIVLEPAKDHYLRVERPPDQDEASTIEAASSFTGDPGQPQAPVTEPSPVEVPVVVEQDRQGDSESWVVPLVLGSGAFTAVAVGIVFGLLSESRAREERNYDRWAPGANRPLLDSLADDARTFSTAANISFTIGAALLVGAVVNYLLADDEDHEPSARSHPVLVTMPDAFLLGWHTPF